MGFREIFFGVVRNILFAKEHENSSTKTGSPSAATPDPVVVPVAETTKTSPSEETDVKIKKGSQEQAVYVLDFTSAVEALAQYIEAGIRERVPRHPGTVINLNPQTKEITLVVPVQHTEPTVAVPPNKKDAFH